MSVWVQHLWSDPSGCCHPCAPELQFCNASFCLGCSLELVEMSTPNQEGAGEGKSSFFLCVCHVPRACHHPSLRLSVAPQCRCQSYGISSSGCEWKRTVSALLIIHSGFGSTAQAPHWILSGSVISDCVDSEWFSLSRIPQQDLQSLGWVCSLSHGSVNAMSCRGLLVREGAPRLGGSDNL